MWAFYVNRGQAIASFGIENKDNPILEFEPANKAYQTTPYTGFRTFLKLQRGAGAALLRALCALERGRRDTSMCIGMNELELHASSAVHRIHTDVLYFILPGEPFAALVRQVTVTNAGRRAAGPRTAGRPAPRDALWGEQLGPERDGPHPRGLDGGVQPGAGHALLPLAGHAGDTAEVEIQAGHFYLAFDGSGRRLAALCRPGRRVWPEHGPERARPALSRQPLADLRPARADHLRPHAVRLFRRRARCWRRARRRTLYACTATPAALSRSIARRRAWPSRPICGTRRQRSQPAGRRAHRRRRHPHRVAPLRRLLPPDLSGQRAARRLARSCWATRRRPSITSTRASTATWSAITTPSSSPPSPIRRATAATATSTRTGATTCCFQPGGGRFRRALLPEPDPGRRLQSAHRSKAAASRLPPERRAERAGPGRPAGRRSSRLLAQPFTPGRLLRAISRPGLGLPGQPREPWSPRPCATPSSSSRPAFSRATGSTTGNTTWT